MRRLSAVLLPSLLVGCASAPARLNLRECLAASRAKLQSILPGSMVVSRSDLLELDQGTGILLHASPRDSRKAHRMFAVFLWPRGSPKDIPYETGQGAHTFRRIGSSKDYRVYYANPSGFMKDEVRAAFCPEEPK